MISAHVQSGSFKVCEQEKIDTGNLFDPGKGTFEVDTESWTVFPNNIMTRDINNPHSGNGCLKVECVDYWDGGYLYLRAAGDLSANLVIGTWYKLKLWARVNSGSMTIKIETYGGVNASEAVSNTEWEYFEFTFQAGHTTSCHPLLDLMSAGQIVWIDDITIQEIQPLATGDKWVECVTAGEISFPQNKCYGQWEFQVSKAGVSLLRVCFANDLTTLTGATGILVQLTDTERAAMQTVIAGALANTMYSAEDCIPVDTWFRCKVTRTLGNEYSFYVDDILVVNVQVGGSNPFTNAVPSESQFCVIDMDAGDRIRNFKWSYGAINTPVLSIPIEVIAGQVNFSVSGGGMTDEVVSWDYPDGTATNWDMNPDETLISGGTVWLNFWKMPDWSTLAFDNGSTYNRFVGNLSVFGVLSYWLYLATALSVEGNLSSVSSLTHKFVISGASLVEGDLSSLSNITHELSLTKSTLVEGDLSSVSGVNHTLCLYGCFLITGDLSSVSGVTYKLNLDLCSLVTGDLSSVSGLTYYLNLDHCVHVTGNLSSVSGVTHDIRLTNCSLVEGNLSSINAGVVVVYLANCSLIEGNLSSINAAADSIDLDNCFLIEGNLSSLSGTTYSISLSGCPLIEGNLSSVNNVMTQVHLNGCVKITGVLTPTSIILYEIYLNDTDTSAADISQSLINVQATVIVPGTFTATHVSIGDLTPAGEAARVALVAAGWTVTLGA